MPLSWRGPGFLLLAGLELTVPVWAERSTQPTAWHPDHIAERYGLFTLIVLGECVLAATTTVQAAIGTGGLSPSLVVVAAGGLVLLFALWWSYFDRPAAEGLRASPGRHSAGAIGICWCSPPWPRSGPGSRSSPRPSTATAACRAGPLR